MPPAVDLLNYISCSILWRIFCQTGTFRGVFSTYHCTVKKFDEVVRHLHLVTQDQFSLVSEKDSVIHEENFNIDIELF